MSYKLYLIEDDSAENLNPLALSRPVFDLRIGLYSLLERWNRKSKTPPAGFVVRPWLAAITGHRWQGSTVNEIAGGDTLLVNARLVADAASAEKILALPEDTRLRDQAGAIIAARCNLDAGQVTTGLLATISKRKLRDETIEAPLIVFPWDLIQANARLLAVDAEESGTLGIIAGVVADGTHLVNRERIGIASGAVIKPGVTMDASGGPIIIAENAEVMANAALEGPLYLGPNSKIKMGAKIYGGTSIGPVCKIGGEVEGSIIHGYSNKQHEGFLGHAYIGEWCNLGADTNNSDLKNNYSPVDVIINGKKIETGQLFVGLIMGDHSKSGINVMFNTGTVVGFSCNVFGPGYLPKYIPSFTWLDNTAGPVPYKIEKAIEVAERVMERRKITFAPVDRKLFEDISKQTQSEHQPS